MPIAQTHIKIAPKALLTVDLHKRLNYRWKIMARLGITDLVQINQLNEEKFAFANSLRSPVFVNNIF